MFEEHKNVVVYLPWAENLYDFPSSWKKMIGNIPYYDTWENLTLDDIQLVRFWKGGATFGEIPETKREKE